MKCAADRSMVPRRRWDDALEAPHWATVQTLTIDYNTPQWWLKALIAKPTIRSLRTLNVFTQCLVRESAASPWRLSKPAKKPTLMELNYLRVFAKGLSPAERAAFEKELPS